MISTTYVVGGMTTGDDVLAVKDKVSGVPGIGAVAAEVVPGRSTLILKHKDDVVPDRAAIAAALAQAGDYTLD